MFAAMASVALASCVKNEPVATVEQGAAITFNAPVVAPVTKASKVAYTGEDFNVFGYYSTVAEYAGNGSLYINNALFTDKGDYFGGKTNTYQWPKDGYLSFVAYAKVGTGSDAWALNASNGPDKLVLDFEVPTDGVSNDILYSDWAKNQTSENQTAVNPKPGEGAGNWTGIDIAFHHALAGVKFTVKAKDAAAASAITIQSITLGKLNNKGTLTFEYDETAAVWATAGTVDYTVLAQTGTGADSKAITVAGEDYAQFYLLPQSLADVKLTVKYFLKGDTYVSQTEEIELDTATDGSNTIGSWEMAKKYNYTLVFGVDAIKLSPVVAEDWTTVNVTDIEKIL